MPTCRRRRIVCSWAGKLLAGWVAVAGPAMAPGASLAQEILTNESIRAMSSARLPEAVIVAKIRSAEARFDLSAAGLIALKQAGVADRVLEAMMDRSAAATSRSIAPVPALAAAPSSGSSRDRGLAPTDPAGSIPPAAVLSSPPALPPPSAAIPGPRGLSGGPAPTPALPPTGAEAARQGKLGVNISTVTPEIARELGSADLRGAVIREVLPGSPAAEAGLRVADVLTAVNGQSVRSAEEVVGALEHRKRGERTALRLVRRGAPVDISVPGAAALRTAGEPAAPVPPPVRPSSPGKETSVAGTYRCWSQNVGGAGGRCTSPPLVLFPDGTYRMSGERGTYVVRGDQVLLSESKLRGPGQLQEGNRIVFEYTYNGLRHTVTYLRQGDAASAPSGPEPQPGAPRTVPVEITLRFAPSDGAVGWINAVALVPEGGREGPEALARTDGKQTVAASFRAVPAGRAYALVVSSGLERRAVGRVDLRDATGPVALTVNVPAPKEDRDRLAQPRSDGGYAAPRSEGGGPAPAKVVPAPAAAPAPQPQAGPPCNPSVPRYAQANCKG